jgi:hypothetical protein
MVGLAAGLEISKILGAAVSPGKANWAATSYPFVPFTMNKPCSAPNNNMFSRLTQGTFVLTSGRLGAIYGH